MNDLRRPWLDGLSQAFWLLLCIVLPISGHIVPVVLGLSMLFALVMLLQRRPVISFHPLWPLFAFYALHIIGMGWTTDTDFGLFDLQVKLGLVILPIAAAVMVAVRSDMLRRSMVAFTAGTLVAMVLGLYKAWSCYAIEGQLNCFSQSTLSFELHPSYAAWYACWCIAYWGYQLITGRMEEKRTRIALLVLFPLVLLFTMMLASKSGVIGIAVVMLVLLGLALWRLRGRMRKLVIGSTLLVVIATGLFQGPLMKARIAAAWGAFASGMNGDRGIYTSTEGSAMRMVAWKCSLERLCLEPLGAGTGDIKQALMECYEARSADEAAQRRLNSHSQFLQGGVALGWPGLLLTLLLALVPMFKGWRDRDLMVVLFVALYSVNAAVESVLEVQAGVVFFALFLGLLVAPRSSSPRKGSSPLPRNHDPLQPTPHR